MHMQLPIAVSMGQHGSAWVSMGMYTLIRSVTGQHKIAPEDYKTVDSGEEDHDNSGIDQP